ncbi:phage portal protein, partial [Roseateles cavernae]|uniref:phage portal protein n=1 Tax=Roseateles cavernae TaxID=3153578 RepID=UPI0032E47007
GPAKSSRIAILDAGMKAQKVSVEPDAAQFIETRQHQVEEICRWFGVPPHKVMHLLRATFTNIEHQSIEVVVDSVTPWVLRMEQEGDFKLFGRRATNCYNKMDLKGLLRGDFKSRQEGLQIQRRNGVINANDWCRLEDMPEIGPDGDKYIVEGNMTTLKAIGEPKPEP